MPSRTDFFECFLSQASALATRGSLLEVLARKWGVSPIPLRFVPMCGRYVLAQQAKAEKAFGLKRLRWYDMHSYNVAPAREVPVIRNASPEEGGGREGVMMRWGLVPSFLKGEAPK